ncbi:MAG: hypothetical protein LH650_12045 [Chloroflexi bacterium]|nr:hypothetical protein [Chloroflexota bacterium]
MTVHYPDVVECPDTGDEGLQQCINSVFPGSTVVLTSEIIDEVAVITKDLTLRATDRSLQPLLTYLLVRTEGVDPLQVIVQDIRFSLGVRVNLTQGENHDVRLRRLEVGKGAPNTRGVEIATSVPASITVENSYIRGDDRQGDALGMIVDDPDGAVTFRAIANRVNQHGNPVSGSGINVTMEGDGSVRADLMNNAIWDVGRCNCGAASGIAVLPYGAIIADVNIVGNTIERSLTNAVQQRNGLTGIGRLRLDMFDNIFSHIQKGALDLDSGAPGSLTFRAGYNDYYATGVDRLDGQSKGSNNMAKDPKFVNRVAGNLKLMSSSPLIDKGQVCSPGGVAIQDASGNTRLRGASVDMGAYERGAGPATGKARVGTSGANILTGTSGADILCGYAGNDKLTGKGGADYLDGGSDDDKLCARDGVRGNDRLLGGPGTDRSQRDSGDSQTSVERSTTC